METGGYCTKSMQTRYGPTHNMHLMAIRHGRTVCEAEPPMSELPDLAGDEGDKRNI